VAVHSGRIVRPVLKAGLFRPRYRVSFRAGSATFYDLPFPKPPIRTVMRRIDLALRVDRPYARVEREAIRVWQRLEKAAETRVETRGSLETPLDLSVRVCGEKIIAPAVRVVVVRVREQHLDTAQRVEQQLNVRGDLELTLFHVLLNETHLISI